MAAMVYYHTHRGSCRRSRSVQYVDTLSDVSENWSDPLRQWLCPAGVSTQRFRPLPPLADRPPVARCGLYRSVHARAGFHHRDFHWLSCRGMAGSLTGNTGHFLAVLRVHRSYSPRGNTHTALALDSSIT